MPSTRTHRCDTFCPCSSPIRQLTGAESTKQNREQENSHRVRVVQCMARGAEFRRSCVQARLYVERHPNVEGSDSVGPAGDNILPVEGVNHTGYPVLAFSSVSRAVRRRSSILRICSAPSIAPDRSCRRISAGSE